MRFFVGLHHTSDARHFPRCCISVRSLYRLRHPERLAIGEWIMDSGAFTEVSTHGGYRTGPGEYAREVGRWLGVGELAAVVAQDWMCEPFILERTGRSVADHQRLTVERYDALCDALPDAYVMPVLQGYRPDDYLRCLDRYGQRLGPNAWVGVGSLCKRNGRPEQVLAVLAAIGALRPDLRLHGFGVKLTALTHPGVRRQLATADSMAWSYNARRNGRDRNSWLEAAAFVSRVEARFAGPAEPWQGVLAL